MYIRVIRTIVIDRYIPHIKVVPGPTDPLKLVVEYGVVVVKAKNV